MLRVKEAADYSEDLDCGAELQIKELGEAGEFKGYASVFGKEDLQGEIVVKGAFKRSIDHRKGKFPLLWQHDQADPIGSVTVEEDEKGLAIKDGRFMLSVSRGRDAYELVKGGIVEGLSIGFKVKKSAPDKEQRVLLLKEIALFEVSVVTIPANPLARISRIKSGAIVRPEFAGEFLADGRRVKALEEKSEGSIERVSVLGGSFFFGDVNEDGALAISASRLREAAAHVFTKGGNEADRAKIERHFAIRGWRAPWEADQTFDDLNRNLLDVTALKGLRADDSFWADSPEWDSAQEDGGDGLDPETVESLKRMTLAMEAR